MIPTIRLAGAALDEARLTFGNRPFSFAHGAGPTQMHVRAADDLMEGDGPAGRALGAPLRQAHHKPIAGHLSGPQA